MKNVFLILSIAIIATMLSACTEERMIGMPNIWIECNQNLNCAAKKAGFTFPLILSNYNVRAMKDMIEITYPLDETRDVCVRKSSTEINGGDLSGDYNQYPIKEDCELFDSVHVTLRRDNNHIYVMYFSAESGYFSVSCAKGMSLEEAKGVFKVISEAEASKIPDGV